MQKQLKFAGPFCWQKNNTKNIFATSLHSLVDPYYWTSYGFAKTEANNIGWQNEYVQKGREELKFILNINKHV
jgi:hypothetical protein